MSADILTLTFIFMIAGQYVHMLYSCYDVMMSADILTITFIFMIAGQYVHMLYSCGICYMTAGTGLYSADILHRYNLSMDFIHVIEQFISPSRVILFLLEIWMKKL